MHVNLYELLKVNCSSTCQLMQIHVFVLQFRVVFQIYIKFMSISEKNCFVNVSIEHIHAFRKQVNKYPDIIFYI